MWSRGLGGLAAGYASLFAGGVACAQDVAAKAVVPLLEYVFLLSGVLVLLVIGLLVLLQWRFFKACKEHGKLELFAESPFGVPVGSVRSALALTIVLASLGYIGASIVGTVLGSELPFPEIAATVLGTVLGFYFGSRGGAASAMQVTELVRESVHRDADRAVARATQEKDETLLGTFKEKATNGVRTARVIADLLPERAGAPVKRVVEIAEATLGAANALAGQGKTGEALAKVQDVVGLAKSPLSGALGGAIASFKGVLGTAVPVVGVALAIAGIGGRLVGAAYDRWVARVLGAPHTPELFPPTIVDADMTMMIVRRSPVLRAAYQDALTAGDRAFFSAFKDLALSADGADALWQEARFGRDVGLDREQVEAAATEFQREVMNELTVREIPGDAAAQAGGAEALLGQVDRLQADTDARVELEKLVLLVDGLKQDGQPVEKLFAEAAQALEGAPATTP